MNKKHLLYIQGTIIIICLLFIGFGYFCDTEMPDISAVLWVTLGTLFKHVPVKK